MRRERRPSDDVATERHIAETDVIASTCVCWSALALFRCISPVRTSRQKLRVRAQHHSPPETSRSRLIPRPIRCWRQPFWHLPGSTAPSDNANSKDKASRFEFRRHDHAEACDAGVPVRSFREEGLRLTDFQRQGVRSSARAGFARVHTRLEAFLTFLEIAMEPRRNRETLEAVLAESSARCACSSGDDTSDEAHGRTTTTRDDG